MVVPSVYIPLPEMGVIIDISTHYPLLISTSNKTICKMNVDVG